MNTQLVSIVRATLRRVCLLPVCGCILMTHYCAGQTSWMSLGNPVSQSVGSQIGAITRAHDGSLVMTSGGDIYRGTGGGFSYNWTRTGVGGIDMITSLVTAFDGVLYAGGEKGIYRSTDNGTTWALDVQQPGIPVLSIVAARKYTILFAGTIDGTYSKTSANGPWTRIGRTGYTDTVKALSLSNDEQMLYVGTTQGVLVYNMRGGNVWELPILNGMSDRYITAVTSTSNGTVVAGTLSGIFRLPPGASLWQAANAGLANKNVVSLLVLDNDVVYAGTAVTNSGGLFRSTNGGVTWEHDDACLGDRRVRSLYVLPNASETMLFAGTENGGLYAGYPSGLITDCRRDQMAAFSCSRATSDEQDQMGRCPTAAIIGNGRLTVGISRTGKIVSLYYPSPGYFNHVPYQTRRCINDHELTEQDYLLLGAPPHLGSFAGIEVDGTFSWLSNGDWDVTIRYADADGRPLYDVPILRIEYVQRGTCNRVVETAFVPYDLDVVVRRFQYQGSGTKVRLVYYGNVNPSQKNQSPKLYGPSGDEWGATIPCFINDPGFLKYFVGWKFDGFTRGDVVRSANIPDCLQFSELLGYTIAISACKPTSTGFIAAEAAGVSAYVVDGTKDGNKWFDDATPVANAAPPKLFMQQQSTGWTELPSQATFGVSVWDISATRETAVLIGSGMGADQARGRLQTAVQKGISGLLESTKRAWSAMQYQTRVRSIGRTEIQRGALQRWVMTLRLLYDRENGGIVASPNLQPKYYPMWPRDAIYQLLAWEYLNEADIVKRTIVKLFAVREHPLVGLPYWMQNYSLNGEFSGVPSYPNSLDYARPGIVEEDQMPTVLWFIWLCWTKHAAEYQRSFADFAKGYLGIDEERVRSLADYVLSREVKDVEFTEVRYADLVTSERLPLLRGLLYPSYDIVEWGDLGETDPQIRPGFALAWQSLYTNAAAVAGLQAAYRMFGDAKYGDAATRIKAAIRSNLRDNEGGFYWAYALTCPPAVNYYHRKLSENLAVGWPFSTFDIAELREYYKRCSTYVRDLPESRDVFITQLYFLLMHAVKNGGDDFSGHYNLDWLIDHIHKRDGANDIGYVPERINLNNPCGDLGAVPLGWSQSFGIMLGLYEAGEHIEDINCAAIGHVPPTQWENIIHTLGNALSEADRARVAIAKIWCPVTITATDGAGRRVGIDGDTVYFHDLPQGQIVADSIGGPMALVLPADSVNVYTLMGHAAGPFTFSISTPTDQGYAEVAFHGMIERGSRANLVVTRATRVYRLELDSNGDGAFDTVLFPDSVVVRTVGVKDEPRGPDAQEVVGLRCVPNPFSGTAVLTFTLRRPTSVAVFLYDALGNNVARVEPGMLGEGDQRLELNAAMLSAGLYFYRLQAGACAEMHPIVLVR